ncbi:MAG: DUF2461 domain-containing protein [Ignavibacteriae bacterium]|nr:DUF2461 domain-containing protein [Ignavibacteriota bacterium]
MNFFNKEFIEFMSELEKNNNREWFTSNKPRYEKFVKIPFENFIQHMIYKFQEIDENLNITPEEAIFRIYRDIRFSKDKTPYKNQVSAIIANGGRKNFRDPGVYIEIKANELNFYSGIYEMTKEQIYSTRSYIVSHLNEFNKLLNEKDFKKYFKTIQGEQNKVLPAEFKEAAKVQPLIANKQFYYFHKLPQNKILSKNLADDLVKLSLIVQPMNDFLKKAVK